MRSTCTHTHTHTHTHTQPQSEYLWKCCRILYKLFPVELHTLSAGQSLSSWNGRIKLLSMVVVECGWYVYIWDRVELLWSLSVWEWDQGSPCLIPRLSCMSGSETKAPLASFPGSHACLGARPRLPSPHSHALMHVWERDQGSPRLIPRLSCMSGNETKAPLEIEIKDTSVN